MNQSSSFFRKVVYIAVVGILLIPLSLISRPPTRDKQNMITDQGGVLSEMRNEYRLSQARLSEIDPGSETMKLASLGLRGLAVTLLWMQAIDAKEKKQWDTFSATLNSLVKIQPNFIKVWEFQGHNLSYNVAVEFDDYEQRYKWVKKGINFLTKGIPYNRRDHRIVDYLGFFCGNKIGTADEKLQYRNLFRRDYAFHDDMSKYVNIDEIDTAYGPDHWLLAYEWYDRSVRMVEQGIDETGPVVRRRREMLFYQNKPAQLRNLGLALHTEHRSDEYQQNLWQRAHREWLEYGTRPMTVIGDVDVTLESLMDSMKRIQELRRRLDEIVPGARKQLLAQRLTQVPEEDRPLLDRPIDMLTDEEFARVRAAENTLYGSDVGVDSQIAQMAPGDMRNEANEILKSLSEETMKVQMGDYFRHTSNYTHWKNQTKAESTELGQAARQAQFDAFQLRDQSVFDQYTQRDPITGEETVLPGSIQRFEDAFAKWKEIVKETPSLRIGPLFDDITFVIEDYMLVRELAGEQPWPSDFVLQEEIDYRSTVPQTSDFLPTSETLKEQSEAESRESLYGMPRRPVIEFSFSEDQGDSNGSNGSGESPEGVESADDDEQDQ